jgi:hypothetical protein
MVAFGAILGRAEGEVNPCPAFRRAVGADLATLGFDQRLGDRQSKTGAARLTMTGSVGSIEALEDEGKMLGGDARAGISHSALPCLVHAFDLKPDGRPRRCEAQCIVQQVVENLRQPVAVCQDTDLSLGGDAQHQGHVASSCGGSLLLAAIPHQGGQIDRLQGD